MPHHRRRRAYLALWKTPPVDKGTKWGPERFREHSRGGRSASQAPGRGAAAPGVLALSGGGEEGVGLLSGGGEVAAGGAPDHEGGGVVMGGGDLGAGVDHLLADPGLPDVPLARVAHADLTMRVTEYVVLHVLMHHRRQRLYDAQQRERSWRVHAMHLPPSKWL